MTILKIWNFIFLRYDNFQRYDKFLFADIKICIPPPPGALRKTSFVWKNEQVTFSLPKISLFDNQRRKLRLSKKIHSPLQDGIARMDKSSSKRAFITFLVWNLTFHFDCVKYWRIFIKPLHLATIFFLSHSWKNWVDVYLLSPSCDLKHWFCWTLFYSQDLSKRKTAKL